MPLIPENDKTYIMNKYHDQSRPFDPFRRFLICPLPYGDKPGMRPDAIRAGIAEQDKRLSHLPHAVRKARAFAYVLEHTRLSCDARDRFPAIECIDRPLNDTLIAPWYAEVFGTVIPETERERAAMERSGTVTMWPDFDHSVPDWDRLFSLGFSGILAEARAAREAIASQRDLTREEDAFFEGIFITYEAMLGFLHRLEDEAARTPGAARMQKALAALQKSPPATVYETLLFDYLYFLVCEHIDNLQVRSLGNLDRLLFPAYLRDIAAGVSEIEIKRDLAYFLLQFTAIGNYWNQPFYLGGTKADGESEINALSYLILDTYDELGLYNPKIQIKVADNTPEPFLRRALDMIRRGHNSIVFVFEKHAQALFASLGRSAEAARTCDVRGCYELAPRDGLETGMNYVNLLKPLEYLLYGGCDAVSGEKQCDVPTTFPDFDSFYAAYKKLLADLLDRAMAIVDTYEKYLARLNPQSLLSATYPTCLSRALDAMAGGAAYNDTCLSFGFTASVADSLTVIRRLVFEQKKITLAEFSDILRRDYAGAEELLYAIRRSDEKYGNNKDLPDFFARDAFSFAAGHIHGRPNARGGVWSAGAHVARMSYVQGALSGASPDGRRRGEELSKNISPAMGRAREGVTAAILSALKMDFSLLEDAALDIAVLPSAVAGEDGMQALLTLLRVYGEGGGHALQCNVFSADTLRQAQKAPENYADLQIRVCGWNVLWNHIDRAEQDVFIRQVEALEG